MFRDLFALLLGFVVLNLLVCCLECCLVVLFDCLLFRWYMFGFVGFAGC